MASDSKIKKGKPLNDQSREIVYNVFLYFQAEAERFDGNREREYFKKIQDRVSEATGVSKRTIIRILNEVDKNEASSLPRFTTPKKGGSKKKQKIPKRVTEKEDASLSTSESELSA